ncbi:MAG: phosphoribosylanthranilate isomerase [Armatimonadia bacterium]
MFQRRLLKVCGLTRVTDLRLAQRLGVDYLGAILEVERSPRSLSRETLPKLLRCAPRQGVVVTVSEDLSLLEQVARTAQAAAVQLHGGQSPELAHKLAQRLPSPTEIWGVLAMPADSDEARRRIGELAAEAEELAQAGVAKVILDSKVKGISGGTGVPMNWELAAQVVTSCRVPVLLAGGLTPANAAEALSVSAAAGLDVSSSVEASPGVKSPQAVRALALAVANWEPGEDSPREIS